MRSEKSARTLARAFWVANLGSQIIFLIVDIVTDTSEIYIEVSERYRQASFSITLTGPLKVSVKVNLNNTIGDGLRELQIISFRYRNA